MKSNYHPSIRSAYGFATRGPILLEVLGAPLLPNRRTLNFLQRRSNSTQHKNTEYKTKLPQYLRANHQFHPGPFPTPVGITLSSFHPLHPFIPFIPSSPSSFHLFTPHQPMAFVEPGILRLRFAPLRMTQSGVGSGAPSLHHF